MQRNHPYFVAITNDKLGYTFHGTVYRSHHFDGFLEPVFVILSGKSIGKHSSTFVLPQQQQAIFIRNHLRRSVQHSLQQNNGRIITVKASGACHQQAYLAASLEKQLKQWLMNT